MKIDNFDKLAVQDTLSDKELRRKVKRLAEVREYRDSWKRPSQARFTDIILETPRKELDEDLRSCAFDVNEFTATADAIFSKALGDDGMGAEV